MNKLTLVTGGAGFIGSNVAAKLAAAGKRVVICDWLGTDQKWKNVSSILLHDIIRPEVLSAWLSKAEGRLEAVIHMGAISATTERDVDRLVRENFRLTLDLWEHCSLLQIPFIYASSAATYGDGSNGFDDDESVTSLSRLRPLNAYGWSKLAIDRRILSDARSGQPVPKLWAGLRFFNVYGPNELHKDSMRSVAQQMLEAIENGGKIRLFRSHHPDYEDGGQLRDFVYVDDCVDVIAWLLEGNATSGIYNVGTGTARSFKELAGAVFAHFNEPADLEFIDTPLSIRSRYQYFTQANISKLRNAGYVKGFASLEEGIRRFAEANSEDR